VLRHGPCLMSGGFCADEGSMKGTGLKGLFRQIFALPAGLTGHQQQLIRASFERVLPIEEAAAALFYERLFALDPRLTTLFKGGIDAQCRKLMVALRTVADHSHCLGRLVPALRELGRRYDNHGATDRDYDTVAAALIWTLEQELGANFTAETREARTTWCGILANEMKAAAYERKIPLLPPC
jgi:hemoglobin-like flavoprotein